MRDNRLKVDELKLTNKLTPTRACMTEIISV